MVFFTFFELCPLTNRTKHSIYNNIAIKVLRTLFREHMNIIQYSEFIGVTVIAIVLVMRACYFVFIVKRDPINAFLPNIAQWYMNHEKEKKTAKTIMGNS